MFTHERTGTAYYDTNGGLAQCQYHILRDGYNDDMPNERRMFIVIEQGDQHNGKFAPSIQIHWEQIVANICEHEGLQNYMLPNAPSYTNARSVHWYEWWPVEIHGPPLGYDLIWVQCAKSGEREWVHIAAHLHDAMLTVLSRATNRVREIRRG